jgi:hypothetical protein
MEKDERVFLMPLLSVLQLGDLLLRGLALLLLPSCSLAFCHLHAWMREY